MAPPRPAAAVTAAAPAAAAAATAAAARPGEGAAAPAAPAPDGFVDFFGYAAAAGGWVFCGWSAGRWADGEGGVAAHFEGARVSAEAFTCWHERPDLGGAGTGLVAFLKAPGRTLGAFKGLEVRAGARRMVLPANRPLVHLREAELLPRARQVLLGAEGDNRARLLGLLSRRPYLGQDTLHELPAPVQIEVDEVVAAPPDGALLVGWCLDPTESVAAVRVRCGALASEPLGGRWLRVARQDVVEAVGARLGVSDPRCGFVAFAPGALAAPEAGGGHQPLHLEVELKGGEIGYKNVPAPKLAGTAALRRVLEGVRLARDEIEPAFDRVLGPPLAAINAARLARPRPRAVVEFGRQNPAPACSVIVPLYGRMDFLLYQLATLSAHEGAAAHELLYVLDEPARKEELLDLAHSAHRRFGLPFRVVALDENLGYGPANNVGLEHARGEFICFLNSDVMPDEPRWLDLLLDDLRADPGLGVVGARLLFEDGTLQHDGMSFERLPQFGDWPFPMHPGKGRLPRDGGDAAALADAEAVTGACMVLRADVARELGGFDEAFAIGDFEDTDLCLRIRRKGLRCAVDRRARLFHLERQSQVTPDKMWRFYVTLLNAWTHTRRWFPGQAEAARLGVGGETCA